MIGCPFDIIRSDCSALQYLSKVDLSGSVHPCGHDVGAVLDTRTSTTILPVIIDIHKVWNERGHHGVGFVRRIGTQTWRYTNAQAINISSASPQNVLSAQIGLPCCTGNLPSWTQSPSPLSSSESVEYRPHEFSSAGERCELL